MICGDLPATNVGGKKAVRTNASVFIAALSRTDCLSGEFLS